METKEAIQLGLTIFGLFISFITGTVVGVWNISKYINKIVKELTESSEKGIKALNDHAETLSRQIDVMNNTIEKNIVFRLLNMEQGLKDVKTDLDNLELKVLFIDKQMFEKKLAKE